MIVGAALEIMGVDVEEEVEEEATAEALRFVEVLLHAGETEAVEEIEVGGEETAMEEEAAVVGGEVEVRVEDSHNLPDHGSSSKVRDMTVPARMSRLPKINNLALSRTARSTASRLAVATVPKATNSLCE